MLEDEKGRHKQEVENYLTKIQVRRRAEAFCEFFSSTNTDRSDAVVDEEQSGDPARGLSAREQRPQRTGARSAQGAAEVAPEAAPVSSGARGSGSEGAVVGALPQVGRSNGLLCFEY